MITALAGKGGVGKTTIAATLVRMLARSGHEVVAIDADSNPNLAVALGAVAEPGLLAAGLPASLVSRRLTGPALGQPLEEVLAAYSIPAPDGARLLHMGMPTHAGDGCLCAGHASVSAVLEALQGAGRTTVVDLEASPEHLARGTARHVDLMLLVTEAYYRSLETVRRLAVLAAELPIARIGVLANKVRNQAEADAVSEFCARHSLQLCGALPYCPEALEADLAGTAVLDRAGTEPLRRALWPLLPLLAPAAVGQP